MITFAQFLKAKNILEAAARGKYNTKEEMYEAANKAGIENFESAKKYVLQNYNPFKGE